MRGLNRVAITIVLLLPLLACSDPAEPHDDIDAARRAWLDANVVDYRFEVSIATSWFPPSGFYQVRVVNRNVVSAVDEDGSPVNDTVTIDTIWDRILSARAQNQINAVSFDNRGVPLDTDVGPWPVDGGTRYRVRNFTPGS